MKKTEKKVFEIEQRLGYIEIKLSLLIEELKKSSSLNQNFILLTKAEQEKETDMAINNFINLPD